MKLIIILMLTIFFSTNFALAEDPCKNVGILQVKKSKECLNKKKTNSDNSQNSSNILTSGSKKVLDSSKKVLDKLNTDSKLTDYIKKKMSK